MTRVSRKLSETGIYHVMLRGNERRKIFLNDGDRKRFLDILSEKSKEKEFSVLAYCLMDNHIHMLIREGKDQINRVMKRIGISYVYYFNKKYNRTGHLFQDRFKSEPINDERYLMAAVRYIHNNPVEAIIVKDPVRYRWSSYNSYINKDNANNGITDRDFILKIFSDSEEQAVKQFISFSKEQADEEFIDIEEKVETDKKIKNEAEALNYIKNVLREKSGSESNVIRNEIILYLKENSTLSVRQIAAIMGINRNIVQRAR